ncbi:DUF6498-containing protein [Halobaculum sp. MBLA0143]|uniref:DUF6498-containing protein n=1 Tax=Halobaculum sp. MBLA0143 TaxID=3079933 RepID=UPI0035265996
MPALHHSLRAWLRDDPRRRRLLALAVTNLLPVVGVVALGWSVVDLLVLYWLELGFVAVFTLVRVPFAGPPQSVDSDATILGPLAARGANVRLPVVGRRLWIASALTFPLLLAVFLFVWVATGGVLLAPFGTEPVDARAIERVGVVAVLVVGTDLAGSIADAVDGGDRTRDPRRAALGAAVRLTAFFLLGLFTLVGAATVTRGPEATIGSVDPDVAELPLLFVILAGKSLLDLAGLYGDRIRASVGLDGDGDNRADDASSGDTPVSDGDVATAAPDARRIRPASWSRVLGGLTRLADGGVPTLAVLGGLAAVPFAIGGVWSFVVGILSVTALVVAGLSCLDHWLRFGAVVYRVTDDGVTARDTRFEATLWRVAPWDETGLRVERDLVDRLLDTETLVVECRETNHRLPHLSSVDPVVAVFDREVEREE